MMKRRRNYAKIVGNLATIARGQKNVIITRPKTKSLKML
jgi:hypothetical protein